MSYINMDHAGWVERNIAASQRQKPAARDKRNALEHKGWFAAPHELNPFQRRAFGILGIIGNGIYNAPIAWDTVYWDKRTIAVSWFHSLGTFDFTALTRLVFLCHEARIRGEISPKGFQHIEIVLSERVATGSISQRHPNIEEALAAWRNEFPIDHSIVYREQPIPRPAESIDPAHAAAGGVLIPSMVAEQAGEQDAGETIAASASAVSSPALLAPAEPGGCEGGRGHAPEVNSK